MSSKNRKIMKRMGESFRTHLREPKVDEKALNYMAIIHTIALKPYSMYGSPML